MDKQKELDKLEKEIRKDSSLPLKNSNLVFGEGDAGADVLFIGEAPGAQEDKIGRPFVGRSGKLLSEMIKSIGWSREGVYITNIVKRRPPNNRDPEPEEIEKYKPYLKKQIQIINPKIIAPLGRFAMEYFLTGKMISKDQGKGFWLKNKIIFPIYHPAAALRNGSLRKDIKEAFQKLKIVVDNYNNFKEKREEQKKNISKKNKN